MDYSTGKFAFIGIVAVVLAVLGSWLLAWRYRTKLDASGIGTRLVGDGLQQLFVPRAVAEPSTPQPAGVR